MRYPKNSALVNLSFIFVSKTCFLIQFKVFRYFDHEMIAKINPYKSYLLDYSQS